MTTDNKKPELVLTDGNIKAASWKREGQNNSFYVTSFSKTYKDEHGKYQNSFNFSGTDLLKISELAKQSYQQTRELQIKDRHTERSEPERETDDRER